MDFKPGNVVIDGVDVERPPRLLMVVVDLDVAFFVNDEQPTVVGGAGLYIIGSRQRLEHPVGRICIQGIGEQTTTCEGYGVVHTVRSLF
jgi:hypothetical protein